MRKETGACTMDEVLPTEILCVLRYKNDGRRWNDVTQDYLHLYLDRKFNIHDDDLHRGFNYDDLQSNFVKI